jgi:hypothetical protein
MNRQSMWKTDSKAVIHRIVWFLLDVGAPGHVLMNGWQVNAAQQLGMTNVTLSRQVKVMVEKGILKKGEVHGEFILNTSIFSRIADKDRIRMRKIQRAKK